MKASESPLTDLEDMRMPTQRQVQRTWYRSAVVRPIAPAIRGKW